MKLLTLNTHSLLDADYRQKLDHFIDGVLREKPDIIALQEVNQTADEKPMPKEMLAGQYPLPGSIPIRRDNHAAVVARRLRQAGLVCYWVWLPVKRGYDKYDEGLAIISLGRKIRCVDHFSVSKNHDYNNWRSRAVLGIQVEGWDDWFYCLHMGWWDDTTERFPDQWKTVNGCLASKRMCGNVWLLGDFNAPDAIPGQSYEYIVAGGWVDTYRVAQKKDTGLTVSGVIDGWQKIPAAAQPEGMRLDYIWCSKKTEILSSRTMFSGGKETVVSDHFGVLIETKETMI